MSTTDQLRAVSREASEAAARIDAKIKDTLLKRARKQGMTNQDEAIGLIEAWKRATRERKRPKHRRSKAR
jgi:hypothetical protein